MEFSPIRSKLMTFDETPSKNIVNSDINGWMETNLKKNQLSQRPASFGIPIYPKKQQKTTIVN